MILGPQKQNEHNNNENIAARVEKEAKDKASDALVTALTRQVANLTKQHNEMMAVLTALKNNNNVPNGATPTVPPVPAVRPKRIPVDEGGYCWSHGYLVNKGHTCENCHYPKPGHQTTATRTNNMGGSQHGKPV